MLFFSNCAGLIYLAIKPLSIRTAFGFPPSTLAVEFCCSETRACSYRTRPRASELAPGAQALLRGRAWVAQCGAKSVGAVRLQAVSPLLL